MPEAKMVKVADDLQAHVGRDRRRVGLAATAVLAWIGCAIYLTTIPSPPNGVDGLSFTDTAGHLFLGILLGGCALCLVRSSSAGSGRLRRRYLGAAAVCAAFLCGTEVLQYLAPGRQPAVGDAVADIIGIAVATVALGLAFSAGPRVADLAADGFVGFAIAAAAVVIVISVVSPGDAWRSAWPVRSASACVERYDEVDRSDGAIATGDIEANAIDEEPLLLIDFMADPDRSSGRLQPIEFERLGTGIVRSNPGITFASQDDVMRSAEPVADLSRAMSGGSGFSVEAWFRPIGLDQTGPARIVSISSGLEPEEMNVHIGVHENRLSVRLRTECGPLWFVSGDLASSATHVAATLDGDRLVVFVDGSVVARAELRDADLGEWDASYHLLVGNEASLDRPFKGTVSLIAFHDEALTGAEVARRASDTNRRAALDALD